MGIYNSHIPNGRLISLILVASWALVTLLFSSGCINREKSLPFETIVSGNPSDRNDAVYADNDLEILNTGQEAYNTKLALWPGRPGSIYEKIVDSVDYETYLAIIAIYDARSTDDKSMAIESITQKGKTVQVIIHATKPSKETHDGLVTLHAVKIKKLDLSTTGTLTFVLVKDGEVLLTKEHTVSK